MHAGCCSDNKINGQKQKKIQHCEFCQTDEFCTIEHENSTIKITFRRTCMFLWNAYVWHLCWRTIMMITNNEQILTVFYHIDNFVIFLHIMPNCTPSHSHGKIAVTPSLLWLIALLLCCRGQICQRNLLWFGTWALWLCYSRSEIVRSENVFLWRIHTRTHIHTHI